MKYLIYGNGYFGNILAKNLGDTVIDVSVDITDSRAVRESLAQHDADVLINCAGKTGRPNVDWCEDHRLETLSANVTGPLVLLEECQKRNQYWVQLGSGCIYDGDNGGKGWSETDPPNFRGSYYSKTKEYIDEMLQDFPVLQVRLRMPIDSTPGVRNLITKIASYEKVISTSNSISAVPDVIYAIKRLTEMRKFGVYNVVNPGVITHKEILDMYKEIVDPEHVSTYISLEDLQKVTKAPRSNCVLSTEKLIQEGIHLIPVHDRVRSMLAEYKEKLEKKHA